MIEERVPLLEFGHEFILAEGGVEIDLVRHFRQREEADAQGPPILIPLDRAAISIAPGIRRIIVSAGIDDRPVEEIGARIMRIAVGVENIGRRELAGGDDEIVRLPRAGDLVRAVFDFLLRPAQADGKAAESALGLVIRLAPADLVRLAAREAGDTERIAEPEALIDLGIEVELDALPRADAGEQRRIERLAPHAAGVEAVRPAKWRGEGRVVLIDEGRLAVEAVPIRRAAVGRGGGVLRALGDALGLRAGGERKCNDQSAREQTKLLFHGDLSALRGSTTDGIA